MVALALVASLSVVVPFVIAVAHTDWGRAKVLALALPRLQGALGGPRTVARLGGDPFGTVTVHDLALDDAEGRPAIRARRLAVRVAFRSLLRGPIRITVLQGDGVWVGLHLLADGRVNLETLAAARPPAGRPATGRASDAPPRLVLVLAGIDAVVRFEEPRAPPVIRVAEAAVHVVGAVDLGERIVISLHQVDGAVLPPLGAPLHASGRLVVAEGRLSIEEVRVALGLNEALLGQFAPARSLAARLGPAAIELSAGGPANRIEVALHARCARSRIDLAAAVTIGEGGIGWRATAQRDDATLRATGRLDWSGHGEVAAELAVANLARLQDLGLPPIGGRLRVAATVVRSARATTVAAAVHAQALVLPSLRIGRLDARLRSVDQRGELTATARGVRAAALRFDTLVLGARGDPRALAVTIDAHGPQRSRFTLALHGAPVWGDGPERTLSGARAELTGALAWQQQSWRTAGPAHLAVGRLIRL
ncbi:MAG TPA: hypothetical protein VGQ83_11940, partial [Polyangia bacterium]